jgi:hypothetical protein
LMSLVDIVPGNGRHEAMRNTGNDEFDRCR